MSYLIQKEFVRYECTCGSLKPISKLYFCRHCLELRCGYCVCHEVIILLFFFLTNLNINQNYSQLFWNLFNVIFFYCCNLELCLQYSSLFSHSMNVFCQYPNIVVLVHIHSIFYVFSCLRSHVLLTEVQLS